MNDERTRPGDSEEHVDKHRDRDDAVIGADDTGILADQRAVLETEIAQETEGSE
ncbi:MAG TPA: hypothetical protein VGN11_08910 [Candidatus Baltobacteraceae bacterium]|jgi:hypothetical protein|nr:hypothetical protein [Candidatus Baltobacteraceae bacterium]